MPEPGPTTVLVVDDEPSNLKILNKKTCTKKTEISRSQGDEAGDAQGHGLEHQHGQARDQKEREAHAERPETRPAGEQHQAGLSDRAVWATA